jgi:hypothetical protein
MRSQKVQSFLAVVDCLSCKPLLTVGAHVCQSQCNLPHALIINTRACLQQCFSQQQSCSFLEIQLFLKPADGHVVTDFEGKERATQEVFGGALGGAIIGQKYLINECSFFQEAYNFLWQQKVLSCCITRHNKERKH